MDYVIIYWAKWEYQYIPLFSDRADYVVLSFTSLKDAEFYLKDTGLEKPRIVAKNSVNWQKEFSFKAWDRKAYLVL